MWGGVDGIERWRLICFILLRLFLFWSPRLIRMGNMYLLRRMVGSCFPLLRVQELRCLFAPRFVGFLMWLGTGMAVLELVIGRMENGGCLQERTSHRHTPRLRIRPGWTRWKCQIPRSVTLMPDTGIGTPRRTPTTRQGSGSGTGTWRI